LKLLVSKIQKNRFKGSANRAQFKKKLVFFNCRGAAYLQFLIKCMKNFYSEVRRNYIVLLRHWIWFNRRILTTVMTLFCISKKTRNSK